MGAPIRVVGVRNVLLEHAMGVEEGAIESNGGAHYVPPLFRISVIEGKDGGLQLLVQTSDLMLRRITIRSSPAGNALEPTSVPPAVKDAEAGNTVERRLHPAGTGSLKGTPGCIQPEIDACG